MKRTLLAIVIGLKVICCEGQITTSKVAPLATDTYAAPYDSTMNFLGKDVRKYIGQELYLNNTAESLRKYGYRGFLLDYTLSPFAQSNIYKCCESFNSKYADLAGKYFLVLDVIKHPKAEDVTGLYATKYFLKLKEKVSRDILYFEYDSRFEHTFQFVVVGYFTKMKQNSAGKEYIVKGKNWISSSESMADMRTGKPVSEFERGSKWKCVDLTIEERFYTISYVLENSKGEQIPLSIDNASRHNWVFEATEAEQFRARFGNENWDKILNEKVKIGMTKEMCLLSWGEPKNRNSTITEGNSTEQWVYDSGNLYFKNGVLTMIQ